MSTSPRVSVARTGQSRRERRRRTSDAVTPAVIGTVLRALGPCTIAEAAHAVRFAGGIAVSGRGLRFLAGAVGAVSAVDRDGVRRYWLPVGMDDIEGEVAVRDHLARLRREALAGRVDAAGHAAAAALALAAVVAEHPEAGEPTVRAAVDALLADTARLCGWDPTAAPRVVSPAGRVDRGR